MKNLTFLLCVALILAMIYDKVVIFDPKSELSRNMTKLIQIHGLDEMVIAEIVNHEQFSESLCTGYIFDWCVGRATATVELDSHYKYAINLSNLSYHVEDDTIVFNVPHLNLSLPVGFSNQVSDCNDDLLSSCKQPYATLLSNVPIYLEQKGVNGIGTAYESAARSLAEIFFQFAEKNHARFFKKIAVIFDDENGKSRRDFSFNKSFCGQDSDCNAELKLGDLNLIIK